MELLEQCSRPLIAAGLEVVNVDCTVVMEAPR